MTSPIYKSPYARDEDEEENPPISPGGIVRLPEPEPGQDYPSILEVPSIEDLAAGGSILRRRNFNSDMGAVEVESPEAMDRIRQSPFGPGNFMDRVSTMFMGSNPNPKHDPYGLGPLMSDTFEQFSVRPEPSKLKDAMNIAMEVVSPSSPGSALPTIMEKLRGKRSVFDGHPDPPIQDPQTLARVKYLAGAPTGQESPTAMDPPLPPPEMDEYTEMRVKALAGVPRGQKEATKLPGPDLMSFEEKLKIMDKSEYSSEVFGTVAKFVVTWPTLVAEGAFAGISWFTEEEDYQNIQKFVHEKIPQSDEARAMSLGIAAARSSFKMFENMADVFNGTIPVRDKLIPLDSATERLAQWHEGTAAFNDSMMTEWLAEMKEVEARRKTGVFAFDNQEADQVSAIGHRLAFEALAMVDPTSYAKAGVSAGKIALLGGAASIWALSSLRKAANTTKVKGLVGSLPARVGSKLEIAERVAYGRLSPQAATERATRLTALERDRATQLFESLDSHGLTGDDQSRLLDILTKEDNVMTPEDLGNLRSLVDDAYGDPAARGLQAQHEADLVEGMRTTDVPRNLKTPDPPPSKNVDPRQDAMDLRPRGLPPDESLTLYTQIQTAAGEARQVAAEIEKTTELFNDLERVHGRKPWYRAGIEEGRKRFNKGELDWLPDGSVRPTIYGTGTSEEVADRIRTIDKYKRDLGMTYHADVHMAELEGLLKARAINALTHPPPRVPVVTPIFNGKAADRAAIIRDHRNKLDSWRRTYYPNVLDDMELSDLAQRDFAIAAVDSVSPGLAAEWMKEGDTIGMVKKRVESHPSLSSGWQEFVNNDGTMVTSEGMAKVTQDFQDMLRSYTDEINDLLPFAPEKLPDTREAAFAVKGPAPWNTLQPKTEEEVLKEIFNRANFRQKIHPKVQGLSAKQSLVELEKSPLTLSFLSHEVESQLGKLMATKKVVKDAARMETFTLDGAFSLFKTGNLEELSVLDRQHYERLDSVFLSRELGTNQATWIHKGPGNPLYSLLKDAPLLGYSGERWARGIGMAKSVHYFYNGFHAWTLSESTMASGLGLGGNVFGDTNRMLHATRGGVGKVGLGILKPMPGLSPKRIRNPEAFHTRSKVGTSIANAVPDTNPAKAKMIANNMEAEDIGMKMVYDFLRDGGQYGRPSVDFIRDAGKGVSDWLQRGASSLHPGLGDLTRGTFRLAGRAQHSMEMSLWDGFQSPVKVAMHQGLKHYLIAVKNGPKPKFFQPLPGIAKWKAWEDLKNVTDIEIGREVARWTGDEFGGQNWALATNRFLKFLDDPTVQQNSRMLFESVDWNTSSILQNQAHWQASKTLGWASGPRGPVGKMTGGGAQPSLFQGPDTKFFGGTLKAADQGFYNPVRGYLGYRHTRNTLLGGFGALQGINFALNGHFTDENPSGKKMHLLLPIVDPDTGGQVSVRMLKSVFDGYTGYLDEWEKNDFRLNPFPVTAVFSPVNYGVRKLNANVKATFGLNFEPEEERLYRDLKAAGEMHGVTSEVMNWAVEFAMGELPFSMKGIFRKGGRIGRADEGFLGIPGSINHPIQNTFMFFLPLPSSYATMSIPEAKARAIAAFRRNDPEKAVEIMAGMHRGGRVYAFEADDLLMEAEDEAARLDDLAREEEMGLGDFQYEGYTDEGKPNWFKNLNRYGDPKDNQ